MFARLVLFSAAACLVLAGCQTRPSAPPKKRIVGASHVRHVASAPLPPVDLRGGFGGRVQPVSATYMPASPYTLGSGDRLRITVFGQENLSRTYPVDAGGFVSLPLIGAVPARGATTFELEDRIAAALRQKYIKDPKVTVEVEIHRPFFILGEVRNGGQYAFVPGMTVETAVAIAGGFTARARKRNVQLTRQVNGAQVIQTVPATWKIRPGDTITVKERFF